MAEGSGKKRAIPELSVDSRMIYDRLKTIGIGDTVEYKDLSAIIGRNVQKEASGVLQTAKRMAFRDDHLVFATVMNVGLKRLGDTEIVGVGESVRRKMRRLSERRIRVLLEGVQDFDKMPNEAKIRHNAEVSIYGAIRHMTTPAKIRQIETAVQGAQAKLPVAKTLELFRS